ncbi:hypothetical protein NIES2109_40930 [Nostoc sp. HK-01]|nr:hypothetical protein NIES2109_40930 [Nostoc sp. HK-01]
MIKIIIGEMAASKGVSLDEISRLSGISIEEIQSYSTIENITEDTFVNLRKIAARLNLPVLDLVQPIANQLAFKFKISEMAKTKGLTLEELSEKSRIQPAIIEFYNTQAICQQTLTNPLCQTHLGKITEVLNCSLEELQFSEELPPTYFRLEEIAKEKGLTLDELSLLIELPKGFVDLIATIRIDYSTLSCEFCCKYWGSRQCGDCKCNKNLES